MYVRVMPGEQYCKEPRGLDDLPVAFDDHMLSWLRSKLTPNQWYIYCTLIYYENKKLAMRCPSLDELYETMRNFMTRDQFDMDIQVLQGFYIEDERYGDILKLIEWAKEE